MLCHVHRCIFVHVPKTAGQSIERAFLDRRGLDWEQRDALLLRPNTDPARGPHRLAHLLACEYLELGYVTPTQFAGYFKFAFVRNPWARLVSHFRFSGKGQRMSFREFVLERFPVPSWGADYTQVRPQVDYVIGAGGTSLVDFVGRFEDLQHNFDQVCRALRIPPLPLPHQNPSVVQGLPRNLEQLKLTLRDLTHRRHGKPGQARHYSEYYDDETREFVARYYARDIATWGYAFERA